MRVKAVCLILLISGLSRAAALPSDDFERRRRILDFGLWNNRINELYDIGDLGHDAFPLLIYASDDADWQVRLTATHFIGKLGPPAASALGVIVNVEPCPRVRVSALRWLTSMGPAGRTVLQEVMSPEDKREMESLPDRYGTERMGKPLVIDSPGGEMTPQFFDHGLDLRVCASSEYADRRRRDGSLIRAGRERIVRAPAALPEEVPREDSFEPVVTSSIQKDKPMPPPELLPESPSRNSLAMIEPEPPAPADKSRREPELDDIRPLKTPETFPAAGSGFDLRPAMSATVGIAASPDLRPLPGSAPRPPLPAAEAMPAAGPGLFHEPSPSGEATFVADAGTGKPENDPIPELIRRLSSVEPRTRARAADELGKRGQAALPAVPALRRALKDRDRRVRASAVLALGGVGYTVEGVLEELRRALRDNNEDVRFSAVIALQRVQEKTALPDSGFGRKSR